MTKCDQVNLAHATESLHLLFGCGWLWGTVAAAYAGGVGGAAVLTMDIDNSIGDIRVLVLLITAG